MCHNGVPLMVRSIKLAIEMIDTKIEDAARTLGASPIKGFFTITLPISIPGIIVGTTLSFARSLESLVQQLLLFLIFQEKRKQFQTIILFFRYLMEKQWL